MATTRIMPLHVGKGRTESRAISDIIDYVANPKKTDNGRLITGYASPYKWLLPPQKQAVRSLHLPPPVPTYHPAEDDKWSLKR